MATPSTSSEAKRELDANATSPRQSKKRKSTSNYMYEELFLNGVRSDITVRALGKEWKLHKCHLCQSEYFDSMFSERWREADEKVITIIVPCDVNERALHTALASFYSDEVPIPTENVLSILSAASFLQLESLIDRCKTVILNESISAENVVEYTNVAMKYYFQDIEKRCLKWMDTILMQPNKDKVLIFKKKVGLALLERILDRQSFIVPNELYLFQFILSFVWGEVRPERKNKGEWPVGVEETGTGSQSDEDDEDDDLEHVLYLLNALAVPYPTEPFLSTDEGAPYVGVFRRVRMQPILQCNSWASLNLLYAKELLLNEYEFHMRTSVIVQTQNARIPWRVNVSDQVFAENCIRCGIHMEDNYKVRDLEGKDGLGWNCGSILLTYSKMEKTFSMKLKVANTNHERIALCRIQVFVRNESGKGKRLRSGILEVSTSSHSPAHITIPEFLRQSISRLLVRIEALFVLPVYVPERRS